MRIWATRPRWLVDVKLECIVPGDVEAEFVALSYTYGSHIGLPISDELIAKLREPYALREPNIEARLPAILRHAMFLTDALDERYLWIDALCVVHESSAETGTELSRMGAIYANAIMTIISTDGDAEDGIVGLEGASSSREVEQRIIPFGDRKILIRDFGVFSLTSGLGQSTPYFSRAWTYQEHKMAKRKIFFLRKQAHSECQLEQHHEDTTWGARLNTYIEPRLQESLAGFPVLGSISNIIGGYNKRDLRYPEDALPGITGMLSVLSRSFEGGFLCGIPEMFFDRTLAWKPYFSTTHLQRRIESGRPKKVQLSPCYLPSWSWVGWQGLIYLGEDAGRIMDRDRDSPEVEETYPITEWYTAISPTAEPSQRRRVPAKWYENREEWKRTGTLPPGWTRIEVKPDEITSEWPHLSPAGCEGAVYQHRDMPKAKFWGPSDEWFFPFPVRKISETMPESMPEQTPYLFCRTQRASVSGRKFSEGRNIICLHNRCNGNIVGTLRLHSEDQLSLFNDIQNGPIMPGSSEYFDDRLLLPEAEMSANFPLEPTMDSDLEIVLIAISLTRLHFKTWNKESSSHGKPFFCIERYNVLWVEWIDGIAYRKAAGLVRKEQWEQLDLEDVDIVLG